jgi:hypothetical protein
MESANRIAGTSRQSCHRAPLGKPIRFGGECPLSGAKRTSSGTPRNVRYRYIADMAIALRNVRL